ncbi:MAG: hypothetical protein OHK0013_15800 [Sandaracinaceae bacterium]
MRASEPTCPFCASALPASALDETATDETARPGSRSALVLGLAVGAIALSAQLFGTGCPMYGGPPVPDQRDACAVPDTGCS